MEERNVGMETESAAGDTATEVSSSDFTPIAGLVAGSGEVNILAACIAHPWPIGKNRWKTRLADPSGEIHISTKGRFNSKWKPNAIVKAFAVRVSAHGGTRSVPPQAGPWLVVQTNTKILVDPEEDEDVKKLKEWNQNQVSEKMNKRAEEGFTPISDLNGKHKVHVLAVCVREPWAVGRAMWKTLFRDPTGQIIGMKRNREFGFKVNDVVAAYSMLVGNFKGDPELEFRTFTDIVVNPDTAEASKLKEWYLNQVSQVEDQAITQIANLKKNTTVNVLAVCTSDPMERPTFGDKRRAWQATMRDASGYMNAMKDDSNFNFGLNDVVEARQVFVREFILGVEMVFDETSVIKVNPDTEEATKLREWYQTQGIRDCVELTGETDMKLVEAAQNQLRSNNNIRCAVCNVWCSGNVAYKNHVTGKSHQNAVMAKRGAVVDKNGAWVDGEPPSKKTKKSDSENDVRCTVCDVTMSGGSNYDNHLKGARHMKKVLENELVSFVSTVPHIEAKLGNTPGMEYRCIVCNAYLSSNKVVIINHLKGAKHVKAVARTENTPQKMAESSQKGMIECKVCNVFVNSQAVLEIHRNSPKHKAKELAAGHVPAEGGPQGEQETSQGDLQVEQEMSQN